MPAGFVLSGGRSSRMRSDKALLRYGPKVLVEHVAGQVLQAAGTVTLIGDPQLYSHLGFPVCPDLTPGQGPLGGIYTALSLGHAEWNLILACDLPKVAAPELRKILEAAELRGGATDCVVPLIDSVGRQPLCAAYHVRCLPKIERALQCQSLKLMDLLDKMDTLVLPGFSTEMFQNVNTPADWEKIEQ